MISLEKLKELRFEKLIQKIESLIIENLNLSSIEIGCIKRESFTIFPGKKSSEGFEIDDKEYKRLTYYLTEVKGYSLSENRMITEGYSYVLRVYGWVENSF